MSNEALQLEVAERVRAEERIKASLEEKVVLLKEIHHRVKNNLQVISSLLNLQSKTIQDEKSLEILKDSQNRVRSMALVHEKLYRSSDLARIDFGQYVRDLAGLLLRTYKVEPGQITLALDVDDVHLGVDRAVPCGLIISELVSNGLKHAFPNGREGAIRVACSGRNGDFMLTVSDNGVGFPEEVDFRRTESLGLQLANTLVDQLEGTIEQSAQGETKYTITFQI